MYGMVQWKETGIGIEFHIPRKFGWKVRIIDECRALGVFRSGLRSDVCVGTIG
jgi:hypothetical protein